MRRRHEIVFNRVTGADDFDVLQSFNRAEKFKLNLKRQAVPRAVCVNFFRRQPFRLKKNAVAVAVGKFDDFIFQRRAIARADARNRAVIERAEAQAVPNDFMRLRVRRGDMAGNLRHRDFFGKERQRLWMLVAGLRLQIREINRFGV